MSRTARAWIATIALFGGSVPAWAADPTGVSSTVSAHPATTDDEKRQYAAAAVQEISDAERQIKKMLEQLRARKDADADNVQCLVNAESLVGALKQVAINGQTNLNAALTAREVEKADHEWRKIGVALEKTRQLLAEAQRCASTNQLESGTTLVDWESAYDFVDQFLEPDIDDFDIDIQPPSITPFQ